MRRSIPAAGTLCALALAAGCQAPEVPPRDALPAPLRPAYSVVSGEPLSDRWWEAFDDPQLNALVEGMLKQNLELKAAWARLDQAAAVAEQAGAGLQPALDLNAGASRTRVNRPTAPGKRTSNLFTIGLAASYEIDLWGRVSAERDAARTDLSASREDTAAAAISLAASAAETWFSLIEQHAQRRLLDEQIAVNRTYLELTELRFAQGQAGALDVYQQRLSLANTRGQIAPVEAAIRVLEHQLTVVLGGGPTDGFDVKDRALPELPALPGLGVPSDILQRRPDVAAAFNRLKGADYRVAAAVADRYPALRLTAGTGYQGARIQDIFDNWIWNIAGNIAAPLFDGGRRKAEVNRAKAVTVERLNAYGQTVLNAVREVEDALAQEEQQELFLRNLEIQVALAEATLKEARQRYVNGLSDYLPVLTALEALHRLQRDRLSARRQLISYRIQLCRAVGGVWPKSLEPSVKTAYSPSGEKR